MHQALTAAPLLDEQSQRPTKTHQKAEPVNLRKLVDKVGAASAAEKIGVATETVHAALRENICAKSHEVAAWGVVNHFYNEQTDPHHAVVSADQSTIDFIRTLVEKAGGNFTTLDI